MCSTFSHQAQLQRATHRYQINFSQLLGKCSQCFSTMAAGANYIPGLFCLRLSGHTQLNGFPFAILTISTNIFRSKIHTIQWRAIHDSQYGAAILYQGDIDGKFIIFLDKFLGAIQRINQPIGLPLTAFFPGYVFFWRFFRQHRIVTDFCQAIANNMMCGEVSLSERAGITFFILGKVGVVNFQDRSARSAGNIANLINQWLHRNLP